MKQALEALKLIDEAMPFPVAKHAMSTLRTAIEQAEKQEPVAAQSRFSGDEWTQCSVEHAKMVMANPHEWKNYEFRLLYTTPPAAPNVATPRVQEPVALRAALDEAKACFEVIGADGGKAATHAVNTISYIRSALYTTPPAAPEKGNTP